MLLLIVHLEVIVQQEAQQITLVHQIQHVILEHLVHLGTIVQVQDPLLLLALLAIIVHQEAQLTPTTFVLQDTIVLLKQLPTLISLVQVVIIALLEVLHLYLAQLV